AEDGIRDKLVTGVQTCVFRSRRNSIQGPSGTATAAPAASPAADSADTPAGPACSTRIAISANAPNPNPVPYALTAYAAHNHPNRSEERRVGKDCRSRYTPSTP